MYANWINSYFTAKMGNSDSVNSSEDCLKFEEIEKILNALLEDTPQAISPDPVPSTSSSSYTPNIDDKVQYFFRTFNVIMELKNDFLKSYCAINEDISNLMNKIKLCVEERERLLKTKLRDIVDKKIEKWNYQMFLCEEAAAHMQKVDGSISECSGSSLASNNDWMRELENVETGLLKFSPGNYEEIITSLQSLGSFLHCGEKFNNFESNMPKLIFGRGGESPGEFCRPWGICSDAEGKIFVCDRSNHRIQVFSKFGEFLFCFGKAGRNAGEFFRPSGVEIDCKKRLIVADKDNHRIQIFTDSGRYLFKFGSQGSRVGQFMYPWDVAANSNCDIAVSDSKNHRIQLFNQNGGVIAVFNPRRANPRFGLKILDSPRGVAFCPDGSLLVTVFNTHKILIINKNFTEFTHFGSEGTKFGHFFRPQGIACDRNGNFAVSDSKNFRIQVFDHRGNFLRSFGGRGDKAGQFDCPQGISFFGDNIIVVDLSNNRIQMF